MTISDEKLDEIINALNVVGREYDDAIGRDHDHQEYGLPVHDFYRMKSMRLAIRQVLEER